MISEMLGGFIKVIYFTGMVIGVLLVLAILGAVNQHVKLMSMAAVGDGFGDCIKWVGELLGQALSHL